jgi:tetratricopeptide (TPR) repeat protein
LGAAVRKAREEGAQISLLRLDLDGFEEGPQGLLGFLSLWGQRHEAETDEAAAERLERVAEIAGEMPPSMASAILLAILLEQDGQAGISAGDDPRASARRILDSLAEPGRLVLHVIDSAQLDAVSRRWLLDEAARLPGMVLAFSCHPNDLNVSVAPVEQVRRLEFEASGSEGAVHLEPVRDLLSRADLQAADQLGRFLDLAALCGRNVPSDVLMGHLEITTEQREELLDLIDEELVEEGEHRLFVDHQYGHPSFSGLLIYSFLHPALNQSLLEHVPRDKRKRLAGELLDFVRNRVPVATRGLARLFVNLAEHTGDTKAREPYLRLLRWWVSPEDVGALTAIVAAELETGKTTPEALLEIADRASGIWPPAHRLALLAALAEGEISRPIQADSHYLRAGLLRESGQAKEALREADQALAAAEEVHGQLSGPRGAILTLTGVLAGDLGDFERARADFEQSLSVHRQVFGDRHPSVAASLANLAALNRHLGETKQARDLFAQALEIAREVQGDDHPFTQALLKARDELA